MVATVTFSLLDVTNGQPLNPKITRFNWIHKGNGQKHKAQFPAIT